MRHSVYEITADREPLVCGGCAGNRWWLDDMHDDHVATIRCSHCGHEEHLSQQGGWAATPVEVSV